MGISIHKDVDARAFRLDFDKVWHWDDLYDAQRQIHNWLDEVNQPYRIVIYMGYETIIPRKAIPTSLKILSRKHAYTRSIMLVTNNPTIISLVNLLNKINIRHSSRKITVVSSIKARV